MEAIRGQTLAGNTHQERLTVCMHSHGKPLQRRENAQNDAAAGYAARLGPGGQR